MMHADALDWMDRTMQSDHPVKGCRVMEAMHQAVNYWQYNQWPLSMAFQAGQAAAEVAIIAENFGNRFHD